MALDLRYVRAPDEAILEEAISLEKQALVLCNHDHPLRALTCSNAANSLCRKVRETGDISLLDEGIRLQREALRLRVHTEDLKLTLHNNLAHSLALYFH
jgi:hypothetical protein